MLPGLLLACVALSLAGCVWTRLLAFKNQLGDFDRYVRVEDRDGLTLHFNEPVLYGKDLLFLMELEPTRRVTNGTAQTWIWTMRKVPAPGQVPAGDFDLTFSTALASNRLVGFTLSERFLASIPKPLLLGTMRSLGQADIDAKRRSATMRWVDKGADKESWPSLTRGALERLLGAPYLVMIPTNGVSTWVYRYRLETTTKKKAEDLQAKVQFSFQPSTDRLARVEAAYGSLKIAYDPSAPKPGKP
jgi:hypothetical protein